MLGKSYAITTKVLGVYMNPKPITSYTSHGATTEDRSARSAKINFPKD